MNKENTQDKQEAQAKIAIFLWQKVAIPDGISKPHLWTGKPTREQLPNCIIFCNKTGEPNSSMKVINSFRCCYKDNV